MSSHELYRHFDKDGRLLYVGISNRALERLCGHRAASEWYDLIVRIEIERYKSRQELLSAEIRAIKAEKPIFNRLHNQTKPPAKPTSFRSPEAMEERNKIIQKAQDLNIKIYRNWCLARLKSAVERAQRGVPFPYQ